MISPRALGPRKQPLDLQANIQNLNITVVFLRTNDSGNRGYQSSEVTSLISKDEKALYEIQFTTD
jgi:hypothetical protein